MSKTSTAAASCQSPSVCTCHCVRIPMRLCHRSDTAICCEGSTHVLHGNPTLSAGDCKLSTMIVSLLFTCWNAGSSKASRRGGSRQRTGTSTPQPRAHGDGSSSCQCNDEPNQCVDVASRTLGDTWRQSVSFHSCCSRMCALESVSPHTCYRSSTSLLPAPTPATDVSNLKCTVAEI